MVTLNQKIRRRVVALVAFREPSLLLSAELVSCGVSAPEILILLLPGRSMHGSCRCAFLYGGEDGETSADYNAGLPVVAFRFSDEFKREFPHIKQENISNLLRAKQYIIPSTYPFSLSSIPSPALHLDPERGSFLEETVLGWVFGYFFKRDLPLLFPYNPFPSHPLEHRTNNHLHPNRLSPPTLNRQDRNPARCSPRKHVLRPSRPLNKRHLRHDSKPHRTFPFPPSPLLLSPTPPLSIFALYAETNKPHRIPTLKTSPS